MRAAPRRTCTKGHFRGPIPHTETTPYLRKCRGIAVLNGLHMCRVGDRTGWLGREGLNLGVRQLVRQGVRFSIGHRVDDGVRPTSDCLGQRGRHLAVDDRKLGATLQEFLWEAAARPEKRLLHASLD